MARDAALGGARLKAARDLGGVGGLVGAAAAIEGHAGDDAGEVVLVVD